MVNRPNCSPSSVFLLLSSLSDILLMLLVVPNRPADVESRPLLLQPQLIGEKAWTWTRTVASATAIAAYKNNLVPEDTYLLLILCVRLATAGIHPLPRPALVSMVWEAACPSLFAPVAFELTRLFWRLLPEIQRVFPQCANMARPARFVRFSLDHGGQKIGGVPSKTGTRRAEFLWSSLLPPILLCRTRENSPLAQI